MFGWNAATLKRNRKQACSAPAVCQLNYHKLINVTGEWALSPQKRTDLDAAWQKHLQAFEKKKVWSDKAFKTLSETHTMTTNDFDLWRTYFSASLRNVSLALSHHTCFFANACMGFSSMLQRDQLFPVGKGLLLPLCWSTCDSCICKR